MHMKKYFTFSYYCLVLSLFLFNTNVFAQTLERIETISGLSQLENNNGVAAADYDLDGDLDIFVVAKDRDVDNDEKSHSRLFRNNNDGSFTDVTPISNLVNLYPKLDDLPNCEALDGYKFGVHWGDYDNDGYPDLFFTNFNDVQLFHNEKNGTFSDVTLLAGIRKTTTCINTGATWVDYNNDSFLDLFICDWQGCSGNTLYKNNGDGTFQNVTTNTKIDQYPSLHSYTMFPFDFNNDGWLDFYTTNDLGEPNSLLINESGNTFIEKASDYGIGNKSTSMGITIGDYDLDGYFDFFISATNTASFYQNALFNNKGDTTFKDATAALNVNSSGWGWGCRFSDFDLDGDEDLFVVNGFKLLPQGQKNVYYKNLQKEGQKSFTNIGSDLGLNELTRSSEVLDFDYDNDGDLDIYVTNTDSKSFFYENKTLNANLTSDLAWLKVSLVGTVSNRDAIGTKLSVTTNEGTIIRYYNGVGMLSQSLKPVHFGLNKATIINELKITWPSGIVQVFTNLPINKTIRFTEQQGYAILNFSPSAKIYGCTDPSSCRYNPLATANDNSCNYESSNVISGPTDSGFNSIESYNYPLENNIEAIWTVEGGKILSGQGTGTITVKWKIESNGKIKVQEKSNNCIVTTKELSVNLNVTNAPENISVARIWNEALLAAIRKDFARPTVHARNLFHTAIALYDSWAIYDTKASPYLMGNTLNGFQSTLNEYTANEDKVDAVNKTMSYAAYRLLNFRFLNSPGAEKSRARFDLIMNQLGYDINNTSVAYESGDAAALGNYIGETLINYGLLDGSNEVNSYKNIFYKPINPPLDLNLKGQGTGILNCNRWQPLSFNTFIDQSGNIIPGSTPSFLGAEWGKVFPFALRDKKILQHDGNDYTVYHQPNLPPQLDINTQTESGDQYKWNYRLVSKWSSHLDASDGVMIDISPKSLGNIDFESFPKSPADYPNFYDENEGGDIGKGYGINPSTGQPYQTQMVPRGDYARVLAEFWADGPDSETPPGHWFSILNYANDHPQFVKKFNGKGDVLAPLEWDVKAYFILGGAVHDAAVTAWGIKGWADSIRPISAIRYLCELGQSTDPSLPNYHLGGIQLDPGFVELIEEGDPLSGLNNANVGKIKLKAWIGHDAIKNAKTDIAGVGWILGENWWPYQRPSFVSPPFGGFISGHSTFSRAAAEVMTLITGDRYFPGGMSEFKAPKNDFLVFEKGPSQDITLQWATYQDASDQCSLSRIWGGIHPPVDDIPGRLIGKEIGIEAYNFAIPYFDSALSNTKFQKDKEILMYPNPVTRSEIYIANASNTDEIKVFDMLGRVIQIESKSFDAQTSTSKINLSKNTATGMYLLKVNTLSKIILVKN